MTFSSNADSCLVANYGQVLSIESGNPIFADCFWTHRISTTRQSDGTLSLVRQRESLLTPNLTRANRGLEHAIRQLAIEHGIEVRSQRRTRAAVTLPLPCSVAAPAQLPTSPHLHHFVSSCESGVIRLGQGVCRIGLMAELIQAFPANTFAIMTSTQGQAKHVEIKLRQRGIGSERLTSRREMTRSARIVVGRYSALSERAIEIEKREILLAFDAREALGEAAQILLVQPDVCGRLYGFVQNDAMLTERERDLMFSTFGFDEVSVPRHGCRPVEVRATFVNCPLRQIQTKSIRSLKHRGIWRPRRRNQLITNLAGFLNEGDGESAAEIVETFDIGIRLSAEHRVVILTDSIEHVVRLARRRRSWPIMIAQDANLQGLPQNDQQLLFRGTSRFIAGDKLIATTDGLQRISPGTFDVIIWAGAGPGLPPIPEEHLVSSGPYPRALFLVDVRDRHHPQLRMWASSRKRLYKEAGWMDGMRSPRDARIRRFLASKQREGRA